MKRTYLLTFLFLILAGPLLSEIMYLKNKKVYKGKVIGVGNATVRFLTNKKLMLVPKSDIRKIQYVSMTQAQKKAQKIRAQKLARARALKRLKIQQEIKNVKQATIRRQKEKELKALANEIRKEKLQEAKIRSERAKALRELVKSKKMKKPVDEPISYMDFAWRSMAIPGWGHFYLDRPVVGSLYAGGAVWLFWDAYHARKLAITAQKKNANESLLNIALTSNPSLASPVVRMGYAFESNRRLVDEYQKNIDRYNHALYLLEAFYLTQLFHIIYNGFAWENGLLIVDHQSDEKSLSLDIAIMPEFMKNEKSPTPNVGVNGRLAVRFRF